MNACFTLKEKNTLKEKSCNGSSFLVQLLLFYEFHDVSHPLTTKIEWLISAPLQCEAILHTVCIRLRTPRPHLSKVNTFSKHLSSLSGSVKSWGCLFHEIHSTCCYFLKHPCTFKLHFCIMLFKVNVIQFNHNIKTKGKRMRECIYLFIHLFILLLLFSGLWGNLFVNLVENVTCKLYWIFRRVESVQVTWLIDCCGKMENNILWMTLWKWC